MCLYPPTNYTDMILCTATWSTMHVTLVGVPWACTTSGTTSALFAWVCMFFFLHYFVTVRCTTSLRFHKLNNHAFVHCGFFSHKLQFPVPCSFTESGPGSALRFWVCTFFLFHSFIAIPWTMSLHTHELHSYASAYCFMLSSAQRTRTIVPCWCTDPCFTCALLWFTAL